MAKLSQILKRLRKDGWYLHKHGSNHDLYRHDTKDGQLTIPRHHGKDLPKGTEHSILKAAGLK